MRFGLCTLRVLVLVLCAQYMLGISENPVEQGFPKLFAHLSHLGDLLKVPKARPSLSSMEHILELLLG